MDWLLVVVAGLILAGVIGLNLAGVTRRDHRPCPGAHRGGGPRAGGGSAYRAVKARLSR